MQYSEQDYLDIIDLPHHVSLNRRRMSEHDRAAQFAPFAALTGYEQAVEECRRLTFEPAELSDDMIDELNIIIDGLRRIINQKPYVVIQYFRPDLLKSGGRYEEKAGRIQSLDEFNRELIFTDHVRISVNNIYSIIIEDLIT